jgi:CubicO group peptidase (beta-lactamase class C family)
LFFDQCLQIIVAMSISLASLAAVEAVFERNFAEQLELGASVSIYWRGEELMQLSRGYADREKSRRWDESTLVPVYSATKAPAAATLLLALSQHGLSEETPVKEVWSRFPLAEATFAQLLSHQCGLAALDHASSVWEHETVVRAIEMQTPAWWPGSGVGYHPRTFGPLLDELVRRLTGITLGHFWQQEIAEPMGWEFWIGLPEKHWSRVAALVPGRAEKGDVEQGFYKEFMTAGTMTRRAFLSPSGLHAVQEMNDPRAWSAGFPAMGGVGTAKALAQFYQAAMGLIESPISVPIQRALQSKQIQGPDQVLLQEMAFTCGCQQDPVNAHGIKMRHLYGPDLSAFGHPGAGGSHAFADPATGLSFAYVMNQMALSVMPGNRSTAMVNALFADSL